MDIQYYGANCVKLSTKKATIVIDDSLATMGGKAVIKNDDIALFTTELYAAPKTVPKIIIAQPGEYEVSNISIHGIQARSHMDEQGMQSATMFKIVADDLRIAVVGHIYPDLSGSQLEQLGTVDVLIVPAGGNGYTLDPIGALRVIKAIEPKVVIPTHYAEDGLTFEVPQQPREEVIKTFGMEAAEPAAKIKIKSSELSDVAKLVILERQ